MTRGGGEAGHRGDRSCMLATSFMATTLLLSLTPEQLIDVPDWQERTQLFVCASDG